MSNNISEVGSYTFFLTDQKKKKKEVGSYTLAFHLMLIQIA